MSDLWISALPAIYAGYLAPFSLILISYLVEKNFVGRIAMFSNAIALNLHVCALQNTNPLLIWYANIGLLFGLIGIITYALNISLHGIFYKISWLYASFVVGFIILVF